MPAKKQVEKKNVVASKNRKKSKPKDNVGTEEAPIIIKGSAQGPGGYTKGAEKELQADTSFVIKSMYPLDFTFETTSIDMKPCVYTLAGTQAIESVKFESKDCNCEISSGEFEITITLKPQ